MAIYRFESRILGRNQGHSSVAYAAYLSAEKLNDQRYGKDRNFSKKPQRDRAYYSEIVTPQNAPAWTYDRESLWNKNEAAEKRKDSQVAREIRIALPAELTHGEKVKLGLEFTRRHYVDQGMVADISFHNFDGPGSHNPHAHILLTTRKLAQDGFAKKKEESWRPKIVKDPKTGRSVVDPEFIKEERQAWERACNQALEQAGRQERVDSRSLKDRGIDRLPQPKRGKAHGMEQRTVWVGQTRAGDGWREVTDINRHRHQLEALKERQETIAQEVRGEQLNLVVELSAERERQRQQQHYEDEQRRRQEQWGWQSEWEREQALKQALQDQLAANREQEQAHTSQVEDARQRIEQWHHLKDIDKERGKPCSVGCDSSHGAKPERGTTPEQQVAKLREEMAAFDADEQHKPRLNPEQGRGFIR